MAVEKVLDITDDIIADGRATLNVGGWDKVIIQLITPTATASFTTTSDGGSITGVSDGSAASATNFTTLSGVKLSDASAVTSISAGAGDSVEFTRFDSYIRVMGPGLSVAKAFARLYKIN